MYVRTIRPKDLFTQFLLTSGLPLPGNHNLVDEDLDDQEAVGFGMRTWETALQIAYERISLIFFILFSYLDNCGHSEFYL